MYGSVLRQPQPTGFPLVRVKKEEYKQRLVSLQRHCPLMWLTLVGDSTSRHIRHAGNGSEFTVYGGLTNRPHRVDGYAQATTADTHRGYVYE